MSYPILKKITQYNQTWIPLAAVGGIQHSTGNGEDSDEGNFQYFNSGNRGANAHFFLDADSITQTVETNTVAYHARNPANSLMWGCEMCETRNLEKFKEIWARQVWLWAHIFVEVANPKITKVDTKTLRSHDEENKLNHPGDPENHQDPTAYFKMFGKTMDDMRREVQKTVNDMLMLKVINNPYLINRPQYWLDNAREGCNVEGGWAQIIILKFVAMFAKVKSFPEAVDWLYTKEIINSPDLWKKNAIDGRVISGANMRWLLIGMGRML